MVPLGNALLRFCVDFPRENSVFQCLNETLAHRRISDQRGVFLPSTRTRRIQSVESSDISTTSAAAQPSSCTNPFLLSSSTERQSFSGRFPPMMSLGHFAAGFDLPMSLRLKTITNLSFQAGRRVCPVCAVLWLCKWVPCLAPVKGETGTPSLERETGGGCPRSKGVVIPRLHEKHRREDDERTRFSFFWLLSHMTCVSHHVIGGLNTGRLHTPRRAYAGSGFIDVKLA